jgi:predicted enzyme related to lactoylglutathione lyase
MPGRAWRWGSRPTGAGRDQRAIVAGEGAVPSATGTAVFLNANPDLQTLLDRVEGAGGKILMPKTAIGMEDAGYFAMISDTEGNTVGLHSQG